MLLINMNRHVGTEVHAWNIWRALFQNAFNHHSRKWACNAKVKFKDCVFGKELFTYAYMHIYVDIYKGLFSKTWSPKSALALQHRFLDWCSNEERFSKRRWKALFQKALSAIPESELAVPIPSSNIVFLVKSYMCLCVYIYEEFFSNTLSLN